jgi:L-arabinonolactonase
VSVVVEAGNLLGESPVWDDENAILWWVDIHGRSLHCWSERTGHGASPLPEQTACIGLCAGEGFVCGTRSGFSWFDPATGRREAIAEPLSGARNLRFNDGRCDRGGRFWSGTVQELRVAGEAGLYCLDTQGRCTQVLGGITVANGIAFSPDDRTMYFSDSHAKEIYALPFDPASGAVGEKRLFVRFDEGMGIPDGATVDADGCLWVAAIGGGRVLRYSPEGRLDRTLVMPVSQPTSCEFGGGDLRTLFVTSARMKLDAAALAREPLAGSIFAIETGARGVREPRYRREARP